MWTSWVSNDAEFHVDFKNTNYNSEKNALLKFYSKITGVFHEKVEKVQKLQDYLK
jgi:hypothetical protein